MKWPRVLYLSLLTVFIGIGAAVLRSYVPSKRGVPSVSNTKRGSKSPIRGRETEGTEAERVSRVGLESIESVCSAADTAKVSPKIDGIPSSPYQPFSASRSREVTYSTGGCSWQRRTVARVPFQMCVLDAGSDAHISRYILQDGMWSDDRRKIMEAMLPIPKSVLAWAAPGGLGDLSQGSARSILAAPAPPAGTMRRVVIDIGSSSGIFTALAIARGYDVISVEPLADYAARAAISAEASGARISGTLQEAQSRAKERQDMAIGDILTAINAHGAKPHPVDAAIAQYLRPTSSSYAAGQFSSWLTAGSDVDEGPGTSYGDKPTGPAPPTIAQHLTGPARPVATVLRAAASDGGRAGSSSPPMAPSVPPGNKEQGRQEAVVVMRPKGNPGASYIAPLAAASVQAFAYGLSGKGASSPGGEILGASGELESLAPVVSVDGMVEAGLVAPWEVALLKIDAEGSDLRVLEGARGLIAGGRPPFIMVVINDVQAQQHGCGASAMVLEVVKLGYGVLDFGVLRSEPEAVEAYLSKIQGRSVRVVLVRNGIRI